MRDRLNPPFSRVSYALSEPPESDESPHSGRVALISAARELDRVTARLGQWADPPGDSAQARQVFYEYAAAMKLDARRLVNAVTDGTRAEMVGAFEDLRRKCDSCHHFFRYGE